MPEDSKHPSSNSEERLRIVMAWLAAVGTALLGLAAFALVLGEAFAIKPGFPPRNSIFAAVIGLPMSAIAALFIVLVLRIASGPIEVEIGPLKFKGGAAPVVFWLICFIAIALMTKLLWSSG